MSMISVIVPVYNVENYLLRCVESIINQTFKQIEIILVDDGSKDSSGRMCDSISRTDTRIKVIHKENGGLSDARNAGIEAAEGEYLAFIDSDDYIEKDMLELLYTNIIKYDAELSVCGYYDCYGERVEAHCFPDMGTTCYSRMQIIERLIKSNGFPEVAWNKLYKREIFEDLRYKKGIIHEDTYIIIDVLLNCHTIVIDSSPKYYYVHRENSIMGCPYNEKSKDIIKAYRHIYTQVQRCYPEYAWNAYSNYIVSNIALLDKLIMADKTGYEKSIQNILYLLKSNKRKVLLNNRISTNRKLSFIILCLDYDIYRKLVKGVRKRR